VGILLSAPVQLAARQRKVEKEKETLVGQWEMYYPACIACGNPLYLLARQVEGGAEESPLPPHHPHPFLKFEATAVDLQVSL
jgi:hypothetical protein